MAQPKVQSVQDGQVSAPEQQQQQQQYQLPVEAEDDGHKDDTRRRKKKSAEAIKMRTSIDTARSTSSSRSSDDDDLQQQQQLPQRPSQFPMGQLIFDTMKLQQQLLSPTATEQQPVMRRRSRSLVGGYEESLLQQRMSTAPSHPLPFQCEIGAISLQRSKQQSSSQSRTPAHLTLPFHAHFYPSQSDAKSAGISPYSATVQLPGGGYRVPVRGQLQLIVKNGGGFIKLFMVQYNLSKVPAGQQCLIRQKSYVVSGQDGQRGALKHAVHLNFIVGSGKECHLQKSMRMVFSATPPEEQYDTVTEMFVTSSSSR